MLALDSASPNTLRMIGAAPAFYLLIGVGMWEAFQFFKERCRRPTVARQSDLFRKITPWAAIAVGAVVGGSDSGSGCDSPITPISRSGRPRLKSMRHTTISVWTELARTLNAQPSDTPTWSISIPGSRVRVTVSNTCMWVQRQPMLGPTHTIQPNLINLPKNIESALAAMENADPR